MTTAIQPARDAVRSARPSVAAPTSRLESVDLLRGVIMVLMALDHTRDYFGDLAANPTDVATAGTALFLTRWITHFCAPVFFLLSGTGAFLSLAWRTRAELSRYLLVRGLWLVVLESTVVRFAWQFNVDYRVLLLNVLWALGWSMVVLSALVWLRVRTVAIIGLAMIALHNLTDGIAAQSLGALAPLWTMLHQPGFLLMTPEHVVFAAYPLVPWIGVMAAGFALGAALARPAERRRRFLLVAGVAATLAFVVLRALNVYGDPRPWTPQATGVQTVLSFLNLNKYPPSLLFLLMTLGPALLVLRATDAGTPRALQPALVYGRVPFFYFVAHVLLLHLLAVIASVARYGTATPMLQSPSLDRFPITQPPGWPAPLPVIYAIWVTVAVLLFPLCKWFGELKRRRRDLRWLGYF